MDIRPALTLSIVGLFALTGCGLLDGEAGPGPTEAPDAGGGSTSPAEDSGESEGAETPEGREVSEGGEDPEESPAEDSGSDDAELVSLERTFLARQGEVTLEAQVPPVVREGDMAAVHLQFDYIEGEASRLRPRDFLQGVVSMASGAGGQVRLVDTQEMTVAHVGRAEHPGAGLGGIAAAENHGEEGDLLEWVGHFDAPVGDSVHVMLPEFGLVEVPVVDGELASVAPEDEDIQEAIEEMTEVETHTYDLMTWRQTHHYSVDIEGEETTVSLPSDVLFDVDSSSLSDEADDALEAAAEEMAGTEGGELEIVGHTDDVLDEDHNQQLSEDRADAVHQRLEDLADLDAFDTVEVRGEAFREPIADNDTEEGRALNRRVELQFTTVESFEDTRDYVGEVPEASGVVADGGDVLEYTEDDGGSFELEVESVERVGNVMVGAIRVEQLTDEGHLHDALCTYVCSVTSQEQRGVNMPQLLAGDYRVDPLRYFRDGAAEDSEDSEDGEEEFDRSGSSVLGDVFIGGPGATGEGDYATVHVLWPAVGADAVELDVPSDDDYEYGLGSRVTGVTPWRFQDVPITDDEAAQ